MILNTGELVRRIAEAKLQGEDVQKLAYQFHEALASMIRAACIRVRRETGRNLVALSGGVFQNQLLLGLTDELLTREGFRVLRHRMIPPNDGGIALGQAAYAMYQINRNMELSGGKSICVSDYQQK